MPELAVEVAGRRVDTAEALRVYDDLCETLRDQSGVAPSAATRSLHTHLIRD